MGVHDPDIGAMPAEAGISGGLSAARAAGDPGLRWDDGSPRFLADPSEAFRSVAMEGLDIVFHRPSGMTHILAAPAPELLALLGQESRSVAELLAALDLADLDGAEALVFDRLAELEDAGLVRRA